MATIQTQCILAARLDTEPVLSLPDALDIVRAVAVQVAELHALHKSHGKIGIQTISLSAERGAILIDQSSEIGSAETRRAADCTPLQRRVRFPKDLWERFRQSSLTDAPGMEGSDSDSAGTVAESLECDVYALAALLCRLLTGATADAYLCSPRLKALVAEPLQPFLDRILGDRTAEPIPHAGAFLSALELALSGCSQGGQQLAGLMPPGDQDSSMAGPLETIDVDSSCVSGIVTGRGNQLTDEAAADAADLPFRKLGHYEIIGRLGHGGMGEVYLGYERGLDRQVAIKVLPASFARDPDLVRRFQAEATAAARLVHPNIIQIFYIGEDAGHHFFAMQYVAGMSLSRLLSRRRLSIDEAVAIADEVLSGLAAAHKATFIHRDIKPSNILLDDEHRHALLADFGLVKSLEAATTREWTATGVVVGTADYMSPEQALGQPVDYRTDLYATGVVMFQMLCGRLPFIVKESSAVVYHHVHVPPPAVVDLAPDVSAPLAAIVAKLLAKSPGDRYQSANEALADLRAAQTSQSLAPAVAHRAEGGSSALRTQGPISADELDTSPSAHQLTAKGPAMTAPGLPSGNRLGRRRLLAMLAAGATVSSLGGGFWFLKHRAGRSVGEGSGAIAPASRNPAATLEFRDHPSEVNCFTLSADERTLIVGDRSEKLIVWDVPTAEVRRTMRVHSGPIRRLILSADEKFAISASADQTLKLWNTSTWKQVTQLNGHVDIVTSVAQVPDRDEIVSSSFDGRLCRWSIPGGNQLAWYGQAPIDPQESSQAGEIDLAVQDRHVAWVRDVVIPPPGRHVVSAGNDRVILIWDLESARVVDRLIGHRGPVMCLAASRDGTWLLSGGYDKTLCLWNLPQRRLVHRIPHSSATPACVAFAPDGRTAASGSGDGLIHFWDVESGTLRATLDGHAVTVTSIRFSENGRNLFSGSEDRTVRVWRVPA